MNKFLIDFSFNQYSMALKFDLLIQRYAILILRYAAKRGINTFSLISQRIRNRIRKYFRVFICGLGVIDWQKTRGQTSRDTVPLNGSLTNEKSFSI
jgi:hypothetical protein